MLTLYLGSASSGRRMWGNRDLRQEEMCSNGSRVVAMAQPQRHSSRHAQARVASPQSLRRKHAMTRSMEGGGRGVHGPAPPISHQADSLPEALTSPGAQPLGRHSGRLRAGRPRLWLRPGEVPGVLGRPP